MFSCLFLIILGLCFCPEESSQIFLERPLLYGPSEALAKKVVEFQCEIPNPKNQTILLQLFKKGEHDNVLGESSLLPGEEVAVIPKVIRLSHEGFLECVASVQNNSEIAPTVSHPYFMKVIEPVRAATIVFSGQTELFEGHRLEMKCKLGAGNHVIYKWLLNDQPISPSPVHMLTEDRLIITGVNSMDNGSYVCEAANIFNNTDIYKATSPEVSIRVKDLVSTPDISFTVLKEDDQNYFAKVTCQSTRGSLPISFSLHNDTELFSNLTTDKRQASFKFPLVMNQQLVQLQCQANNGDQTAYSQRLPLDIEPVRDATIAFSGQTELFEEHRLEMKCNLGAGNHVIYKWLLNDQPISPSPYDVLTEDRLIITRVTSRYNGSYVCEAANIFNNTEIYTTRSPEVSIRVKDLVSTPDISFTVIKEDDQTYFAEVTCQSTRGSLPISFSLHNDTELFSNLTTEERRASFKLPVFMNQPVLQIQCQANNGDKTAYSQWLPLDVVPVAGPVIIDHAYDMAENYAVVGLRLYCKAAKGSHPQFQWYHNNVRLNDRGSFYYVYNQLPKESILLLSVGSSSAGKYHCEVSDSFDRTNSINSTRRYFDKEVLNRLPDLVVAVVFGCFTIVILLVSSCCLMGVMFRRRQHKEKSLLNLEMESILAENELDCSDYDEDPDLFKTAKEDEYDQTSDDSVDEWPQIEQEKKTQEDEPVSETF